MPSKIKANISPQDLIHDLKKYRDKVIEGDADDAKIIDTDDVIVDMRVRGKCHYACEEYNTNMNCPPHVFSIEQTKRLINNYLFAILLNFKVPSDIIAGELSEEQAKELRKYGVKRYQIIGKLEREAFDDGYPLSLGFAGGPCSTYLCPNQDCQALEEGKCRHPLLARPSMEAMGMDVYRLAAEVGWDIYPIGGHTNPDEIPHGTFVGIVFIE
ncbi:MAG: DUF2284 domain-containing protein [Thermoplasmatota archaeon]